MVGWLAGAVDMELPCIKDNNMNETKIDAQTNNLHFTGCILQELIAC